MEVTMLKVKYAQMCTPFIKEHGYITHRDILRLTGANCSYSIMRILKRKYDFAEEQCENNGKRYIHYELIGERDA
jgi:hypothetical protein